MATQSKELFSLETKSPRDVPVHGMALLRGTAQGSADFRRGIDLSAGFDFRAEAGFSAVSDYLTATFAAGVNVRGGIALQAAFPLDLFNEAGVVARLRAQVEAAAYARATVKLELEVFTELLGQSMRGDALIELVGIFLDEIVVEAGVWARAAFAAELLGEAVLSGSLLPSAQGGGGFTFSMKYAVGFIYGTGFDFITNFGINDPHRLTDRLARALADRILIEAESSIKTLPESEAKIARAAMVPAKILVPLAVQIPFQVGLELAKIAPDQQRSIAVASVVTTFMRSVQDLLFSTAINAGLEKLGDLLIDQEVIDGLNDLAEDERNEITQIFFDIIAAVDRISAIPLVHIQEWLQEFVIIIERLEAVLAFDILTEPKSRDLRHVLALCWASAQLLARLQSWMTDPSRRVVELFGPQVTIAPTGGMIGSYILSRIGKVADSPIVFADLITFILNINLDKEVRQAAPAVSDVLDWLGKALSISPDSLVADLLLRLIEPNEEDAKAILAALAPAIDAAVQNEIAPLLALIKASDPDNQAIAIIVDELLSPSLAALPRVFIPQIAMLGTPEAGIRFREALSSVALQTLTRFMITSTDVLMAHGMREGELVLHDLGEDILRLGEQHPEYAGIVAVASHAVVPGGITPREVSELLILAGDILGLLKGEPREGLTEAMQILVALGLSTAETRNLTFDALLAGDDAPTPDQLALALDQVKTGLGAVVVRAVPELLRILAMHPFREIEAIAAFIQVAAREAIRAAGEAIAWLGQQVEQLVETLAELGRRIVQIVNGITTTVQNMANELVNLADNLINRVYTQGREFVVAVTNGLGPIQEAALAVYDLAFSAAKAFLTAPLHLLSAVAGWVRDALSDGLSGGSTSRTGLDDVVSFRIRSSHATSLKLSIKVTVPTPFGDATLLDLGVITISAASILKTVEEVVLSSGVYANAATSASTQNAQRVALESQREITRQTLEGALNQQKAHDTLGELVTSQRLRVEILTPEQNAVGQGSILVRIRVSGINRSYLNDTLGVPRRVVISLNGIEQDFDPQRWRERRDEDFTTFYEYSAMVAPIPEIRPATLQPGLKDRVLDKIALSHDPNLVVVLDPHSDQIRFARATSRADLDGHPRFVGEISGEIAPEAAHTLRTAAMELLRGTAAQGSFGSNFNARGISSRRESTVHLPIQVSGEALIVEEPGPVCPLGRSPFVALNATSLGKPLTRFDPFVPDVDREGGPVMRGRSGFNKLAVAVVDGVEQMQADARIFFIGPQKPAA